jgi:hypothetical protein
MPRQILNGLAFPSVSALPSAASNTGAVFTSAGALWWSNGTIWIQLNDGVATVNASATLGISGTSITYATPAFAIPVNGTLAVGMKYRIKLLVTNTGTAVTSTVTLKYGTNGSTADTTILAKALGTGTAAIGAAVIVCEFIVTAINSSTGAINGSVEVYQTGTTGFTNAAVQVAQAAVSSLNTVATGQKIGVCLTCTTGGIVTVQSASFEIVGTAG